MDDLITWLKDCLSEDEEIANEAIIGVTGEWQWDAERDYEVTSFTCDHNIPYVVCKVPRSGESGEELHHIARHDPAWVLREVEAKRELLREHQDTGIGFCGTCVDWMNDHLKWPCRTVRVLALPFSDRPGYQEGWRP